MTLSIKDKNTQRMARELARLTAESVTVAVTQAIHERLERVRSREGLAERLQQIGRECAVHLKEPYKSIDHGDWLYDEDGLPK